jgi:2,5-diketo-D-gluconate reductase A
MQLNNIAIPKTENEERMTQNLELFDFTLSDSDIAAIDGLNRGIRLGGDPDTCSEL